MIQQIEKLNPESRIWIFQSGKKLSEHEEIAFLKKTKEFLNLWDSHGHPIKSGLEILEHLFLIVIADGEGEQLCGSCADRLIKFIRTLEEEYNLTLLNRNLTAFISEKKEIIPVEINQINQLFESKIINEHTLFINNHISTLGDYLNNKYNPLKNSWQNRFVNSLVS